MGKIKKPKEFPIAVRLKLLGHKQVDLIQPLTKRGFEHISPSLLSLAINGRIITPHGDKLRKAISEILTEWEAK
jgi:hypothetical protein